MAETLKLDDEEAAEPLLAKLVEDGYLAPLMSADVHSRAGPDIRIDHYSIRHKAVRLEWDQPEPGVMSQTDDVNVALVDLDGDHDFVIPLEHLVSRPGDGWQPSDTVVRITTGRRAGWQAAARVDLMEDSETGKARLCLVVRPRD